MVNGCGVAVGVKVCVGEGVGWGVGLGEGVLLGCGVSEGVGAVLPRLPKAAQALTNNNNIALNPAKRELFFFIADPI